MSPANRRDCSRALAKVLAYQACGDEKQALAWFKVLAGLLGYGGGA